MQVKVMKNILAANDMIARGWLDWLSAAAGSPGELAGFKVGDWARLT